MGNGWTPERRAKQAKMIQQWQPWKKATGPRTQIGKDAISQNAFKGGERNMLSELSRSMRELKKQLDDFESE